MSLKTQNAAVAQSVEQPLCKRTVRGSSPFGGTIDLAESPSARFSGQHA